jgi:hypothetical protein
MAFCPKLADQGEQADHDLGNQQYRRSESQKRQKQHERVDRTDQVILLGYHRRVSDCDPDYHGPGCGYHQQWDPPGLSATRPGLVVEQGPRPHADDHRHCHK